VVSEGVWNDYETWILEYCEGEYYEEYSIFEYSQSNGLFVHYVSTGEYSTEVWLLNTSFMDITPPVQVHASITHPDDLYYSSNDTDVIVSWGVTYQNAEPVLWILYLNGEQIQTGTLEYAVSIDVSALDLEPGVHELEMVVEFRDVNGNTVIRRDSVLAFIILVQDVPAGTTDIDLGGIAETTISIDVDSSVEVTIEPTGDPEDLGTEAASSFQTLLQTENQVGTGVFLEIEISDPSALNGLWINISYADWDLASMGIDESTLRIMYFNEDTGDWEPAGETGVDTVRKVIYAYVTHLSAFSAVASVLTPEPTETTDTGITDTTDTSDSSSSFTEEPISGFEIIPLFLAFCLVAIGLVFRRRRT
jgi:hypothetical protein